MKNVISPGLARFRNGHFSRQHGMSMIDALVALVIFSVGMLALASLQGITKQSNYEAMQRAYAANMANELFERMRMNSDNDGTNEALSYYVDSTSVVVSWKDTNAQPPTDCGSTNCTFTEMAAFDIFKWWQSMTGEDEIDSASGTLGGLFQPTFCLSGPGAGASGSYTLTIVWRGQSTIKDASTSNTCGAGDYDKTAGDNAYRRILVMTTYLDS